MQAHEARVYPIENCHSLNVVITPLQQVDISISTRRTQPEQKTKKAEKVLCQSNETFDDALFSRVLLWRAMRCLSSSFPILSDGD